MRECEELNRDYSNDFTDFFFLFFYEFILDEVINMKNTIYDYFFSVSKVFFIVISFRILL